MRLKKQILIIIFIILISLQTFSFASEVNITAKSAILVEVSTGRIIYEKNSTKKMYPASTTKIMTAIVVLENCKLDDIVTVNESALQGIPSGYVTCDLHPGEELTVNDLLYALMVKSGNDVACALAEHVAGSVEAFAEMMNAKAKEIGCTGTHFVNPNGIHDDDHYTTAYDLYLMAKYGMQNETFRTLVSTTSYTLPATNKHPETDRTFSNSNELLNKNSKNYYYSNAIGIKTGTTSKAGDCLVAQSSRDGLDFISVVLDSGTTSDGLSGRFIDTKKLFDYAYDNFTLTKITEEKSLIKTVEIENATKETKNLDLLIDKSITIINKKDLDVNKIIPEIKLKENLQAPINNGEVVGTIKYKVDNIEYSANLLAGNEVVKKADLTIFIIVAGILLLLVGITILQRKKRINRKRKKRRR